MACVVRFFRIFRGHRVVSFKERPFEVRHGFRWREAIVLYVQRYSSSMCREFCQKNPLKKECFGVLVYQNCVFFVSYGNQPLQNSTLLVLLSKILKPTASRMGISSPFTTSSSQKVHGMRNFVGIFTLRRSVLGSWGTKIARIRAFSDAVYARRRWTSL